LRGGEEQQYSECYFHPISFAGDMTRHLSTIETGHLHEINNQSAAIPIAQTSRKRAADAGQLLECVSAVSSRQRLRRYFFLPEPKVGCHPAAFWLGAAAIVLIFSFLGFLDSRLPFCSPLAMPVSSSSMMMMQ
jgi:hypothetical protein